jgi:hypothetical protein
MRPARLITLLIASLLILGCSNTYFKDDVELLDVKTIPPFDLLEIAQHTNPKIDDSAFVISDKTVYKFTYLLQDTMRKRVVHGRKWQEGLSAIQVIFAAFASAFSASTGVHPDVVTTLAGLSALTPDIENIINAGDKARAYSQALDLVEKANSTYISTRAETAVSSQALIPDSDLTPEGAQLFVSVMATLKIMRDALLETIPSQEDIAKASGNYALFRLNTNSVEIKVDSSIAKFIDKAGDTKPYGLLPYSQTYHETSITVVKGSTIERCSTSAGNIASVSCTATEVTIKPQHEGTANITVVSKAGDIAMVFVDIVVE